MENKKNITPFSVSYSKFKWALFILSIAVLLYWAVTTWVNIYRFAFLGAIFEFLWLPMVVLLFGLPVVCLVYWARERFTVRSLHLYSLLICMVTAIILFARIRQIQC